MQDGSGADLPGGSDDNPEWTAADIAAARVGAHWTPAHAAEALREAARAMRREAARLEAEADALAGGAMR